MKKAPITVVTNSLHVGGCERHLATILPELSLHWDIRFIIWGPEKGFFAQEMKGVPVFPLLRSKCWEHSFLSKTMLSFATKMFLLSRALRPGIVHFFLPSAYIMGMMAAMMRRLPGCFVMSRRSLNFYQTPFLRLVEKKCHQYLYCATGNSQKVVQQLREEGIAQEKSRLIYNGINPNVFDQPALRLVARREFGIPEGDLVVVCVANLIAYKGHADLLQAISLLDARIPVHFLCAGRDDGIGHALQRQASALGVEGKVRWLGLYCDMPKLLACADIGLLCSHQEGFSNAVLEGMAAGLPMIVTDVGGNAEAVIHEETGYVVPSHSPSALAEALQKLLSHPAQRALWGECSKKRVAQLFSLSACLEQYHMLYEEASHEFVRKWA